MTDKIKDAKRKVDLILGDNFHLYKMESKVDSVLSEIENQIDPQTDQDLSSLLQDIEDELSQDSEEEQEEDDMELAHAKEEMEEDELEESMSKSIKKSIHLLVSEADFRTFFKTMLGKWNISSPVELDDSKKKKFFNAVDKEWKSKKEN